MLIQQCNDRDFAPFLPKLPASELNWMGRNVERIRSLGARGTLYKAAVQTVCIFASFLLFLSLIGIPFFIVGYREYIYQETRQEFDDVYSLLYESALEQNRHFFIKGRTDPLLHEKFALTVRGKQEILRDLKMEDSQEFSDQDLVMAAALQFENFRQRYDLQPSN